MPSVFFIHAIEVSPHATSELSRSHPKAKGAYVDCYVQANSIDEALTIVRETLQEDGYEMTLHKESKELYRDDDWLYDEMPPGVREKVEEVIDGGDVVYGEFHVW
jgi:hypothetical protein